MRDVSGTFRPLAVSNSKGSCAFVRREPVPCKLEKFMRFVATFVAASALILPAAAQQKLRLKPKPQNAITISLPRPPLPRIRSRMGMAAARPNSLTDAAQADNANAAALKEYGFRERTAGHL